MKRVLYCATATSLVVLSTEAHAQSRQKLDYWYGLTGQLGEVMAQHCKRFNESQTKYEAVSTDHRLSLGLAR